MCKALGSMSSTGKKRMCCIQSANVRKFRVILKHSTVKQEEKTAVIYGTESCQTKQFIVYFKIAKRIDFQCFNHKNWYLMQQICLT